MKLVERLDQEGAAAARRVQHPDGRELVLPKLPEPDQSIALGVVEGVQVVNPRIVEGPSGGSGGFFGALLAKPLETVAERLAEGLADDVPGDEGGGVEGALLLPTAGALGLASAFSEGVELVPNPLQVGDGLLEDVAQNVHVDELRRLAVAGFGLVGGFERGPIIVIGQDSEEPANLVGDVQAVEFGVVGEEAAVVGRDPKGLVAQVDRLEKPPEVLPDGPGVIRVGVLIGPKDGVGGKQPPVFAERAEENSVE